MPATPILDPALIDVGTTVADRAEIDRRNPQRFEFALLDAICYADDEARIYAGYHDVKADAWWVRGHIPGRPLFPGVLMIEVAAQMASFASGRLFNTTGDEHFLGFIGVDEVKFRGAVVPPARLLVIGRVLKLAKRRTILETQGFVNGVMVFEGTVTGMSI